MPAAVPPAGGGDGRGDGRSSSLPAIPAESNQQAAVLQKTGGDGAPAAALAPAHAASIKQKYIDWLEAMRQTEGVEERFDGYDSEGHEESAIVERLHMGAPVRSPRRGRKRAGTEGQVLDFRTEEVGPLGRDGGMSMLPRLMCRPMGTTWREQLGHPAATAKHAPLASPPPPSCGTPRPLLSPRGQQRGGHDGVCGHGGRHGERRGKRERPQQPASAPSAGKRAPHILCPLPHDGYVNAFVTAILLPGGATALDLMAHLLDGDGGESDEEGSRGVHGAVPDPWHPPVQGVEVRGRKAPPPL